MSQTIQKHWIGRAQLLGDTVSVLPAISYIKRNYPDVYTVFPIAKKCSQGAPLYLNHPDINEIFVLDGNEGVESQRDKDKFNSCDFRWNINPQHPDSRYPREFNIFSESWRMLGLQIEEWNKLTPEQQRPKLYKWWNPDRSKLEGVFFNENQKIIGIWPQAGYSKENKRNPSKEYWKSLIRKLDGMGYRVMQFGAETDWILDENEDFTVLRWNFLSFFEQIKLSLECDLCIGTDSGSALILGAYEINQLSLICIHWNNPENLSALSTNNSNNYSFYSIGGTDNIDQQSVLDKIQEKLNHSL